MFYARMIDETTGKQTSGLYYETGSYYSDTFSPCITTLDIINFVVSGKTYAEKQNDLREKAISFQRAIIEAEGLYMGELAVILNWFSRNARRLGLLREFRENGIC